MDITGRVAIVTGASSGIGAAAAVELARRGATVVSMARREEKLEATAQRCRQYTPGSFGLAGDVSRRDDCEKVVGLTEERFGCVDILVNNAGVSLRRHAADTLVEDIERTMQINFFGAVYTTMAALPGMLDRGHGSVVNVTSVAGYLPNPKESAYGASKAALSLWSHGLAVDLNDSGVHIGVLSPGPIDTEIWEKDDVPATYKGRKYPPEMVAEALVDMVENEVVHMTVPRRYGAVGILYDLPVIGRLVRRGLVRYEARGTSP